MPEKVEISLQIPHTDPAKQHRFFSLRLKRELADEMSVFERNKNIFVVSDIGGNFRNLCRILGRARVIDKQLNWIFENGHLVILGNCLNDSDDVLECLWLIYSLEEKAKKNEGYVHFIWGNNELENINGDWRFRHPRYAKSENVRPGASTALYDGSNELWRWLKTKNLVEKIGHTLFVHGSISLRLLYSTKTIEDINGLAKTASRPKKLFKAPVVSDIFDIPDGIESEVIKDNERRINYILRHFHVKRIVTGYQSAEKVDLFYNAKVINVHTDHTSEQSQGLLIKGRHLFRIQHSGKSEKLS
ncbi:hypothetical protein L3C95_04495 [Chitinophaga filiformis]|uniref:hypothetical protein n=1 Tax=Chitinophaga filiformis TaxID=104663 RepID=UPI001F20B2F3|nr:hypothetical protein [Chitinophaga filiformis]MCF6402120.1 hypothetical protein [Chitinophaga filiformis]